MKNIKNLIYKFYRVEILLALVLVVGAGYLRFRDLGYSEYIPDEVAVVMELKANVREGREKYEFYSWDYLLSQRKGPMQYILAYIPFVLNGNIYNEFAIRLPFAISGVLGILFFYLFVKEITRDALVGFFSALLVTVNGFTTAFGRIAQYQSLNLLFSSISLYLFAKNKPFYGMLFFGLSFLSHWDAIFIVPIILFLFAGHIQILPKEVRLKTFYKSILMFVIVVGPFMVPYTIRYFDDATNREYFASRAGYDKLSTLNIRDRVDDYIFRTELYNPFLFLSFVLVFALLAVFSLKRSWIFYLWFVFVFLSFLFFIRKPGTHVYNMLLPLSILAGIGIRNVIRIFPRSLKVIPLVPGLCAFGFMYYQTTELFIDHQVEYPFQQEHLSFGKTEHLKKLPWIKRVIPFYGNDLETITYNHENLTNNIIGFPLYRNWEEVNRFLMTRNEGRNEKLGYITNENRSTANFYMDVPYEYNLDKSYYAVGVKRPLSFVKDYKFSQISGRSTIHKIQDENDDTLVRIYLVEASGK